MDWECCWDRDVIELGDCPNIHEGDEDLLASKRRRILEKCSECENFRRDLIRFSDSAHDDLYVMKYIAPLSHNKSALGLDLGSDPTRREAIEQAVRSGQATMTQGIRQVLDHEHKRPGVLINVPVYAYDSPLDTPEEQQAVIDYLRHGRPEGAGCPELFVRQVAPSASTLSTITRCRVPTRAASFAAEIACAFAMKRSQRSCLTSSGT